MRRCLTAGLVVCWGCCFAAYRAPEVQRKEEIAKGLAGQWRQIARVRPRMGVRELLRFALEAAGTGAQLDKIDRALELAEQMQDREPTSRTYGNFKWYWESDAPHDRNAVQFSMHRGILVWMLFRDRLPPMARERLERLIRFSIEGIRRHNVPESYTNIFLMKTFNCVAIGEATGRPALAREGYGMLDRWLVYTFEHGIHEYLSPTYYGVDLDCLGLLANWTQREQTRRDATTALELFWTDLAANWFRPAGRLGGAHSRDYDYVTGRGYLHKYLRPLGWLEHETHRPGVFDQLAWWHPPKEILKLAADPLPRTVHQRWGGGKGDRAVHYVGRHFSLGSAGATYGPMDKPLTLSFAGDPRMPALNFFMDARGDPYGKKRFAMGASGHSKALHIQPFLTSVQRGAEVLLLASADPADRMFRRRAPEPACLLSQIVVPAKKEPWLGEKRTLPAKGQSLDVPPRTPVFLRHGDVAVGIRFVVALDTAGRPAPVALANDGQFGALRLTVTHSATAPKAPGTVAVWVRAAEGLDEAGFAAFRRAFAGAGATVRREGALFDVAVPGARGTLRLKVNVAKRARLAIEGDVPGAEGFLLAVNGRDCGRKLLGRVTAVAAWQKALDAARAGGKGSASAGRVFEAEDAVIVVPPFQVGEDASASGGKFLWMPGEPGGKGGSAVARALWLVNVPKAGDYRLSGRVRAPTPSDDSFFVRVRQGEAEPLPRTDWHTRTHEAWEWTPLTRGPEREPVSIRLRPGVALVEIFVREDGTKLDALLLTAEEARVEPGKPR